jgi:hypothetical protein
MISFVLHDGKPTFHFARIFARGLLGTDRRVLPLRQCMEVYPVNVYVSKTLVVHDDWWKTSEKSFKFGLPQTKYTIENTYFQVIRLPELQSNIFSSIITAIIIAF